MRKQRNMEKKILLVSKRPLLQKLELGATRNGVEIHWNLQLYTPTNFAEKNRNEKKKVKAKKWGWQQKIIWGKK